MVSLIFSNFPRFQVLGRLATREATRICKIITNNNASFHLCWKENLLKHQKVSSHYEHDCLQKFLSLVLSLLTTLIVQNIHELIGIYFIFLKKRSRLNLKTFNKKFNFYFRESFTSIEKIFILGEEWALSNHSMKFFGFPNISQFLKMSGLEPFGNSYIQVYY